MIRNVEVVSLSSGILGEPFMAFEVKIGLRRMRELGLSVTFAPHALKGLDYVKAHPRERAEDLLRALCDPGVDMVLCAIGGDDTYRLLPYLFGNGELAGAAGRPSVAGKVFLGFSDTTINHFMLHKVGLRSFYGQAFLPDVCELGPTMLPYTRTYLEELVRTEGIRKVGPGDIWYESRTEFSPDQVGTPLVAHKDHGFRLLQGPPVFCGKVLGGCIDSMYDMFNGGRYPDMPELCREYDLFPTTDDWRGRILLLESSEEKMPPHVYRQALEYLRDAGVFGAVSGVLVGKPMDKAFEQEYQRALVEVICDPDLPVVCNVNVGHAQPRCIIPFGVDAVVDAHTQTIRFDLQD